MEDGVCREQFGFYESNELISQNRKLSQSRKHCTADVPFPIKLQGHSLQLLSPPRCATPSGLALLLLPSSLLVPRGTALSLCLHHTAPQVTLE